MRSDGRVEDLGDGSIWVELEGDHVSGARMRDSNDGRTSYVLSVRSDKGNTLLNMDIGLAWMLYDVIGRMIEEE